MYVSDLTFYFLCSLDLFPVYSFFSSDSILTVFMESGTYTLLSLTIFASRTAYF